MQGCATGQHLKEATITRRKSGKGQQEFLVIKMNDVIITSVTEATTAGESQVETVTLAFAKVDSNTGRKSPMDRWMPAFTSSTTSRLTRRRSRTTEPPGNDRALSLDEALSVAVVLQQAEQWAAAAEIYRSILEVAPDHAGALHFSGVLAHQQDETTRPSR